MPHTMLLSLFNDNNIVFQLYEHPEVFTVNESAFLKTSIIGSHSKNLFLKNKKKQFFLVSVEDNKRVDLKALSKLYGKGGLSFGSPEELKAMLNVMPGSVTPYGLMYDKHHHITFILDKDLIAYATVNFHPLRNDMTVSISVQDFLKFCTIIQHTPSIISIPVLI
jgi:Ala-tRNA(Pro) deacylase